jgi:glutamine cyclotransferase
VLLVLLPAGAAGAGPTAAAGDKRAGGTGGEGFRVVRVYPHDRQAFTQGLLYRDGFLYESTGLYGFSSLRKVELVTGRVVKQHLLDRRYFAEGLTDWQGSLLQLTWQSNLGFIYDLASLSPRGTFAYPGEGWGLAQDGQRLIMSDGTAELRFLDPRTQRETGRMTVRDGALPLAGLNELEVVGGEILANVYPTGRIARISPRTGRVSGWIDLTGLLSPAERQAGAEVLNGIAYDHRADRFFVTGKRWPKLYEIELLPRR